MDKITQRFFGLAAVIFAFAFLIRSASPAQADVAPQTNYSTGKYMMSLQAEMSETQMCWYILVWDTESGRSKFYYGNKNEGMGAANSKYQIPSSPL